MKVRILNCWLQVVNQTANQSNRFDHHEIMINVCGLYLVNLARGRSETDGCLVTSTSVAHLADYETATASGRKAAVPFVFPLN